MSIEEPFHILNIRRGIFKPIEQGDQCQRMSIFQTDTNHFVLEADHTLQFNIMYRPDVDECLLDPPDFSVDREFRIQFDELHGQVRDIPPEVDFNSIANGSF
jgi:hypothetical protein